MWKHLRWRPQADVAQHCSDKPNQQNARRDDGHADELQIVVVLHGGRLVELEAERSQRQIDVVMRLPVDPDRAAEQDVEFVQVAADPPAQGFVGIAGIVRLFHPVRRDLGFHGFLLVFDEFEVRFVISEQPGIERLDHSRQPARLLLVDETTQSRPIVLEAAARFRKIRELDAVHFR